MRKEIVIGAVPNHMYKVLGPSGDGATYSAKDLPAALLAMGVDPSEVWRVADEVDKHLTHTILLSQ